MWQLLSMAKDCGVCNFCKDMKKFGGPGRLKKACIQRKCQGSNKEQATGESIHDCNYIQPFTLVMLSKVQTRLKLR